MEALFNYRKPDRVPIGIIGIPIRTPGLKQRFPGFSVSSLYNDPNKSFYASLWVAEYYSWELVAHYFAHTILGGWDFGGEVQMPRGKYQDSLSIKSTPVKSEEDVWSLKMPNPKKAGGIPMAMEFAKLQEKSGLPVWFLSRSPFCVAANICGLEQFCRWIVKKPRLCQRLLRMATAHIFNVLHYWVDTFGAEKIFFEMSSPSESNQVISPKILKEFALPYHIELQKRLRTMGIRRFFFHICGDQNLNLPYLAELSSLWIHPSILSFGHEVDLEVAGKYFPEDIIFGNIEPALFQTGTPQQVYDSCKAAIEKGKRIPGGFMLAPGCELPPMSLPENVLAMTKTVKDLGWYD
jgi:uroporphyrinogen decarboxylase